VNFPYPSINEMIMKGKDSCHHFAAIKSGSDAISREVGKSGGAQLFVL